MRAEVREALVVAHPGGEARNELEKDMKIYRCKRQFLCTPLKRYLPAGAMLARYENATKIVIQDAPRTDQDIYGILADGFVYTNPNQVTWLWSVEPPPLGTNTDMFEVVGSKDEDDYGNVSGTSDGLPCNSQLKVRVSDGQPFMKSVTNGLWYPIRLSGVDGSVTLDIGQIGVPSI